MTSPTTIKRLRELLEKATPSPWHVMADGFTAHKSPPTIYHAGDELNYVAKCADFATIAPTRNLENAELIVEMRNALPALLDRVEAMERALKPFEHATLVGQSALIVAGDAITQAFDSGKKYVTIIMESDAAEAFNAVRLVSEQSQ